MVSVIVPVYNVSQYLRKCLDSIIVQTYSDLEIILIDDGSTDDSGSICDMYAAKDNRIKVIHKENGGLMSAWMCGIEHSTCDKVVFVDSDDWIPLFHIEKFVQMYEKYDADVVVGNLRIMKSEQAIRNSLVITSGVYDQMRIEKEIYPRLLNAGGFQKRGIPISRSGKIIRKELIVKNLKYCDQRVSYAEDLNIMLPVLLDCNTIVVSDEEEIDYYYRMNPNSILHSYNSKMYMQIKIVYQKLFSCVKEKEKNFLINQMYADYLSMMVQCFKNELNHPGGFHEGKKGISKLTEDKIFIKAVKNVDWSNYKKRYRLIINCMVHWGSVFSNVISYALYLASKYKERVKNEN